MPRRPHKKSRSGCAECKKRHIKCDESRPQCVNCKTAGNACSFQKEIPSRPSSAPISRSPRVERVEGLTPLTDQSSSQLLSPLSTSSSSLPVTDPVLNLQHLELLHHFATNTCFTFADDPAQQKVWGIVAVKYGFAYPFLLYEILAISALHLGHLRPALREHYFTKAVELQSGATKGFTAMQQQINAHNCGPTMLFCSLLALHVLGDPTRTRGLDFNEYLDHLIGAMQLMRSIRSLVITDWWPTLKELPELKAVLDIQNVEPPYDIPDEVQNLSNLTQNNALGEVAKDAYNGAIDRVQWLFALNQPLAKNSPGRHLAGWPVQLKDEFFELLGQRQPEALIILAYYAVLLHYYSASWLVNDAGHFLVKTINAHLGRYWMKWMEWPSRMVLEERKLQDRSS